MNVSEQQKRQLKDLANELNLEFVVLYGSYSRGEEREDSDLDIAILAKNKPSLDLFQKAFSKLSDVFRGKNIDLRFLNGADLLFSKQVVGDGILLFGDPNTYDEFRLLTIKRYVDDGKKYFPYLDEKLKAQQEFLNS